MGEVIYERYEYTEEWKVTERLEIGEEHKHKEEEHKQKREEHKHKEEDGRATWKGSIR